jgi:hypothetical protein
MKVIYTKTMVDKIRDAVAAAVTKSRVIQRIELTYLEAVDLLGELDSPDYIWTTNKRTILDGGMRLYATQITWPIDP